MREDTENDSSALDYLVELYDNNGHKVSAASPRTIYPSLAVQLYKQDVFFHSYEYKHQMQTVRIAANMLSGDADFNYASVNRMVITFAESEDGHIILDDLGNAVGDS